ncbi:MAG: gliding motility-associated C-terminal domain-containing protein [Sediminibacterium sp.]
MPGTLSAAATVCATANAGTLSLTGITGNILNWQSSADNGNSWNNIINTTNLLSFSNLSVTTQFRAAVQSGVCATLTSNIVTITVLQPVTIANAGVDQVLCNITSATLNGNTPASGTGTWSFVSGPSAVSFSNANNPAAVVNGLAVGTYQLAWTIANGLCTASQDLVQITVHSASVPGTLAADATVCATANSGTLALTGYSSSILNWQSSTDNGVTWNNIANTTNTQGYTNLAGSTKYRASVQNAICPALYSNVVTINVVQPVSIADAGADIIVINGISSTPVNAVVPTSGIGTWTQISGPTTISFSNKNDPKATLGGLAFIPGAPPTDGIYQLRWTVSNGVCAVSEDIMQVTVQPPTNPGAIGPDAVVCTSNNHGTLVLTGYLGTVLQWEFSTDYGATWNIIAGTVGTNQGTYDYNNLTITTLFRALVQNGVGMPLYSGIAATVTVLQLVTPSNAGPDQSLCNSTTATLAGNTPTSGTGTWTQVSGPTTATFSNAIDPASIISGLTVGTYEFAWTISNGICSDSKDTVQIIIYPPTVAGTLAAAATVCATANAGTLSLSGYVSSVLRWESSIDNGATWSTIANTTNTLAYTNLAASTDYRTYVQNAVCPALFSNTVTVNVVPAVTTANAGIDQQLCNVTAATLAANTPASGTGAWTFVAGPSAVSFTNPNDPATTVNGLTAGTYQFAWTISNGICSPSQDLVQIIVYPPTVAGTLVADAFVCISGNKGTIKLTGYTGKIILWQSSSDSTGNWNAIANSSDTLGYTNLLSTTYYRATVQNGNCNIVQTNIVTVHVSPVSTGGKITPLRDTICATANSGTLLLNGFTGTIMRWESSTDKGNSWTSIVNSDTSYDYNNIVRTTWYRVLIQSSPCSSAYSDTSIITVDSATVAGILADNAVVCSSTNNGVVRVTGITGAVLHWEVSTDEGSTWNTIINSTDTLRYNNLAITSAYRAVIRNGACALLYSNTVTIKVIQPVTIADAGPDQVLCNANTNTTLQANIPASGSGKWSFVSGPSTVSFANAALSNTVITGLRPGTYRFVWTISNGTCTNSTDTVVIKVDNVLSGFNVASINDCGKTTFYYTNTSKSVFGIQNSKWLADNNDTVVNKDHSQIFTTEGPKKISLTVQSNVGCTNTIQAEYDVIVYQFPKVNIKAVTDICKTQFLQVSPDVKSQDSIAYLLWNLGNGKREKEAMITVQYMVDGNYILKLTVATVNRCFDSAFKQITVHPIPDISITSSPIICRGDSAVLVATGANNYIWTDQNNQIICDGCAVTRVKPIYNTRYKVVGYSEYGCSQVKTTDLRVIAPLKMMAVTSDTLCIGQSRQLFASGASIYSWYPSTGLNNTNISTPIANPQTTTTYHVIGKDEFNCFIDTAEVKVAVGVPTPINIGKDTIITAGIVYQFNPNLAAQDIRKWVWKSPIELSCRNCATPQAKISNDVDITVSAINIYGCVSTDTISIKTFCGSTELFVPNAFSPDGDGINDVLLVQGKGIKLIKSFRIFSRWGEMVFEKSNFLPGDRASSWDGTVRGKPASSDVFVYMAEVICEKGLPSSFKGNVAILK